MKTKLPPTPSCSSITPLVRPHRLVKQIRDVKKNNENIKTKKNVPKKKEKTDSSLLKPSIETPGSIQQMISIMNKATPEVLNLVNNECSIIFECKTCKNLFRSLANFMSHKRGYCLGRYEELLQKQAVRQEIFYRKEKVLATRSTTRKDILSLLDTMKSITSEHIVPEHIVLQKIPATNEGFFNLRYKAQETVNKETVTIDPVKTPLTNGHKNSEDKTNGCSFCSKEFPSQKALSAHIKKDHDDLKVCFVCPSCKKYFANTWSVYRHLYKIHRKTSEQVRKLRTQIQKKQISQDEFNKSKKGVTASPQQEKNRDKAFMEDLRGHDSLQRCSGCGKHFERKVALVAHSSHCQRKPAPPTDLIRSLKRKSLMPTKIVDVKKAKFSASVSEDILIRLKNLDPRVVLTKADLPSTYEKSLSKTNELDVDDSKLDMKSLLQKYRDEVALDEDILNKIHSEVPIEESTYVSDSDLENDKKSVPPIRSPQPDYSSQDEDNVSGEGDLLDGGNISDDEASSQVDEEESVSQEEEVQSQAEESLDEVISISDSETEASVRVNSESDEEAIEESEKSDNEVFEENEKSDKEEIEENEKSDEEEIEENEESVEEEIEENEKSDEEEIDENGISEEEEEIEENERSDEEDASSLSMLADEESQDLLNKNNEPYKQIAEQHRDNNEETDQDYIIIGGASKKVETKVAEKEKDSVVMEEVGEENIEILEISSDNDVLLDDIEPVYEKTDSSITNHIDEAASFQNLQNNDKDEEMSKEGIAHKLCSTKDKSLDDFECNGFYGFSDPEHGSDNELDNLTSSSSILPETTKMAYFESICEQNSKDCSSLETDRDNTCDNMSHSSFISMKHQSIFSQGEMSQSSPTYDLDDNSYGVANEIVLSNYPEGSLSSLEASGSCISPTEMENEHTLNKVNESLPSCSFGLLDQDDDGESPIDNTDWVTKRINSFIVAQKKKCKICFKTFHRLSMVRRHVASHFNINKFKCLVNSCNFVSYLRFDMNNHLMKVHKKKETDPFVGKLNPKKEDFKDDIIVTSPKPLYDTELRNHEKVEVSASISLDNDTLDNFNIAEEIEILSRGNEIDDSPLPGDKITTLMMEVIFGNNKKEENEDSSLLAV